MKNLVFMLMASLALVACNDDHSGNLAARNLSESGRMTKMQVAKRMSTENRLDDYFDEYITYSAKETSNGWCLHIEHVNCLFNCATDKIFIKTSADENGVVKIFEVGNSISTNCICPHNLSYDVGPLNEGMKYSFLVYNSYDIDGATDDTPVSEDALRTTFTVNFTKDASGRIEL